MDWYFWILWALVFILIICLWTLRHWAKQSKKGLRDRAFPREGKPVHPAPTPRRSTTVTPGTHFPMDEVRRADDGEGDFATSAMVTAATGSPVLGAMVGGSIAGAAIGSLLTIDYGNDRPEGNTPSTDDSGTSSDSGGDSGGGD